MSDNKICDNCFCCMKRDGPPYYCVREGLKCLVVSIDKACAEYVSHEEIQEVIEAMLDRALEAEEL